VKTVENTTRIIAFVITPKEKMSLFKRNFILWRVYPLPGNDSVNARGKHGSVIERLFSVWPVNTSKWTQDNRRRCFLWGQCRIFIMNSVEQNIVESRVPRRQPTGIWAWNWIELAFAE
jgi:hypothetical protein